jgi:glucose/mannose-6-phosphate isomerase
VIPLDDVAAIRAADPSDMLGAVLAFPHDVRSAYDAAVTRTDLPSAEGIAHIVICGMGGSAVAGDVIRSLFRDRLGVPVEVNRSPSLPAYAGRATLVVASSYSGNTAETLGAFEDAVERGCRVLPVTSGGTLATRAGELGLPVVPVPGGGQPRAALGHLAFAAMGALEAMGILPRLGADVDETVRDLEVLCSSLGPDRPVAENPAKALAERIGDRIPVVWGAEGIAAVAAMRWKTQLNENAKVPAWWATMSELDHNEIVGWVEPHGSGHVLLVLRHAGEHPQLPPRFPLSTAIVAQAGVDVEELHAPAGSPMAALFGLIVLGDFVSVYAGLRKGVDPTPVVVIERLKAALAGN